MNAAGFAVSPLLYSGIFPGTNPFLVVKMFSKQELILRVLLFYAVKLSEPDFLYLSSIFRRWLSISCDADVFLSMTEELQRL